MTESIELHESGYKISITDDIVSVFLIDGTSYSYVNSGNVMLAMFNRIKELEDKIKTLNVEIIYFQTEC
jgi:hypothetical protein